MLMLVSDNLRRIFFGVNKFTFSHTVPPSGIQRIVWTPTADASSISFTRVILVLKCGTELRLGVERGKSINIGLVTEKNLSPCGVEVRQRYDTRVSVQDVKGLHKDRNDMSHLKAEGSTPTDRRINFVDTETRVEIICRGN
jgi:hypothetical protein